MYLSVHIVNILLYLVYFNPLEIQFALILYLILFKFMVIYGKLMLEELEAIVVILEVNFKRLHSLPEFVKRLLFDFRSIYFRDEFLYKCF